MGRFGINRDSYGFEIPDIYNNAASGYTFSAEYQTVYDSFIVKPAADIAQQQDIMVRALVAAGIWVKLDVFYIFANNTRANAVINWMNPGAFDAIEVNAPTFLAYRHFVGNGVNQYLRTQYTPSLHAVNYTLNSASIGIYSRTDLNANMVDYGVNPAGEDVFTYLRFGGNYTSVINENGTQTAVVADSLGFFITKRSAANAWQSYQNSNILINRADASIALPNGEIYICAANVGGPVVFSTRQFSIFFIGADLDEGGSSEVTNFTNTIETYLDYVGAGVIP